jgi:regulator of protease activity HflC (stomatin/prohibitin superfamily)
MSAKIRMQLVGNIQIMMVLLLITTGGWFLHRALGGLFAALVFLGTIYWASQYLFVMYGLDSRLDAFGALLTFMFGVNLPHMIIAEGRILQKSNGTMSKLGGPGVLIVKNDSAVVTETGGRARVLRPGVHLITNRFEVVKEVVDLRPQVRVGTVKAMTKDGFEVTIDFFAGFQIDPGGRKPTGEEPYPFSEQAMLRAVYRSKQVDATGAQTWHERVPGAIAGNVREMIATHYLEDFFKPDDPESDPRTHLKEWLFAKSKGLVGNVGAQLNWVSFSTPAIPNAAAHQFLERWQTKLQGEVTISRADANAKASIETLRSQRESAAFQVENIVNKAQAEAQAEKLRGEAAAEGLGQMIKAMQDQGLPLDVIRDVLTNAFRYRTTELGNAFQRYFAPPPATSADEQKKRNPSADTS